MTDRVQVRCRTPHCTGTLGAFVNGAFLPAAHLIGSRDWYLVQHGETAALRIRCSHCNCWYLVQRIGARMVLNCAA